MRKWVLKLLGVGLLSALMAAPANGDAVTRAADRLVAEQGANGTWAGEEYYTGSIAAGLANASEMTGVAAYKTAAEDGGNYILGSAGGNFYGDEAYALTRLSDISADPANNTWRTNVSTFYTSVKNAEGGTSGYISDLAAGSQDISAAVFYIASHVVAAYYVNAADKTIWRNGLIYYLGDVDDNAYYPVMALGVSVWALAKTGPLDNTAIYPGAPPTSPWYGKTLADLPAMLLGHQVSTGAYAGSFYWRFDHTGPGGEASGYTEDAAFGTLGLVAADEAGFADYDEPISDARNALAQGVAAGGEVYEHIWSGGLLLHLFAGESLQALIYQGGGLNDPGPLNIDMNVMGAVGLNANGPAPKSLGIVSIGANGNLASTLYAPKVGTDPGVGWLHFVNSGAPLNRDDVYATGTEPEWHTAAEWAGKRLRGLTPGTSYTFYAKAKNATDETTLVDVGTYSTNVERDCNRSGGVSVLDLLFTRDAVLSAADIGTTGKAWATDANDSGDTTVLDLMLVRNRVLGID